MTASYIHLIIFTLTVPSSLYCTTPLLQHSAPDELGAFFDYLRNEAERQQITVPEDPNVQEGAELDPDLLVDLEGLNLRSTG